MEGKAHVYRAALPQVGAFVCLSIKLLIASLPAQCRLRKRKGEPRAWILSVQSPLDVERPWSHTTNWEKEVKDQHPQKLVPPLQGSHLLLAHSSSDQIYR